MTARIDATEIAEALRAGRFELWFEPQCHIASGEIHALEGLLRLREAGGDLVPPDAFIGEAENSGLIRPLTEFAVDQAAQWCARWREAGQLLRVSVNVSHVGLIDRALAQRSADACATHGLPAGQVTFELTESALAHDHSSLLETMTWLRRKGFQLSLDDFGSGHATLYELRSLPFDELKLDKELVRAAVHDARCGAFVESSIALASALSLRIIAEGVETQETLEFVSDVGCDYAQGHLIGQPMPGAQILSWLERYPGSRSTNR